jgi:hypothetical protein
MRIAVMVHRRDRHARSVHYVVWPMCDAWREEGHEVDVVWGPRRVDADLVFLHVDRTVVPDAYVRAVAGHPLVVNRRRTDISKSRLSRHRVRSPEDWDGPVIVKSELNCGGAPEARDGLPIGRRRRAARRAAKDYPVYASAREVPAQVFRDRSRIVERFLPERHGDLYGVRMYTFFGGRHVNVLHLGTRPVVQRYHSVADEPVPVPDGIVEIRREIGLDYGKLDYVVRDGEVVLLDVNRTPALGGRPEEQLRHGRLLAPGLAEVVATCRIPPSRSPRRGSPGSSRR